MHSFSEIHRRRLVRAFFALLMGALFVVPTSNAWAYGRVTWKSTTIAERTKNESWRLEMEIHLNRAPDVGSKSMKFEFTQVDHFERALEDGHENAVERTIPLTNQQSIIESQLVGFLDPGSGVIQSRTRFSFKVTRAHGYQAGRWKVKIKDGDTGAQIGAVATLTLTGENPVVDRRSMVFQASDRKKKPEPKPEESTSGAEEPSDDSSSDSMTPPAADEGQAPPSIEEKPGGGCHHDGSRHPGEWNWLALVGLILGGLYLRRRT